jgi:O-antigen/teichoic acid export membrane protein
MPTNTARIAKNTLMLYFRQILIMLVSLYTVRVVLDTLGAEDYGIYNVVGGITVLFSFLNGAMSSAIRRFLNYALGENNTEQAHDVFSISLIIYLLISVLVIILAETAGLWFLNVKLNIPSGRRTATFVVYQFSIAITVVNILCVPYNAVIIAHEKMSFFTLLSILEGILKLIVVFLLTMSPVDVLIFYVFLLFLVALIIFVSYKIYCNKTFEIAHFRYCKDRKLFFHLVSFSGWSIFGEFANASNSQGINILLNIFSGITVNAAMGIATQINAAVYRFVGNFQTAFNPQIVKSYASRDYDGFIRLILQTSKSSYYLLFFFVLPLCVNAEFVLGIWLKNIPTYTLEFTQLTLINSLIQAISGPLWMSIQATGKIKQYQIIVSCFIFANFPCSLILLALGYNSVFVLIIRVALNTATLVWRIFYLQIKINLPALKFIYDVIIPIVIISGISGLVTVYIHHQIIGLTGFVLTCSISMILTLCMVYILGFNVQEKEALRKLVKNLSNKTLNF